MATQRYRTEHDSMGELQVPAEALWGAQTQRAVENFPVSGRPMPRGFIRALGLVKASAASVNAELGLLPRGVSRAIHAAALQVAAGEHDAQFPIDIYQTGSGTSSNMNAKEVIANLASRAGRKAVHPNDHVNLGQSSNDVLDRKSTRLNSSPYCASRLPSSALQPNTHCEQQARHTTLITI